MGIETDRESPSETTALVDALAEAAARAGAAGTPPMLLVERADVLVLRVGDVVVKAHPAETDATELLSRLRLANAPHLRDILLPPLPIGDALLTRHAARTITAWPYGEPVDPDDPDAAPWEAAAMLLARLHALPAAADLSLAAGASVARAAAHVLPEAGGPKRVRRAMRRLRAASDVVNPAAAAVVCRAFATLPESSATARTLVHGDFHLGQLVREPRDTADPWRLIDIDDLGVGDPAWDLARPAALFAAGILEPVSWLRFLDAYRAAGGVAVPRGADEWTALDIPARAVAVQAAALAVTAAGRERRELDDLDTALVDACRRIATASDLS
ncbi:phosphotransferase [Nocardia xishanensis]|uniref:Phosphotransferase family protein n=1 Tax=Nocardia xishanensis TaxID=238964 RepID=A0ABW7WYP4_9NOCA